MARTYREIAMEAMVLTVEEAMSRVLDYWGDLPPSMKEAIEQFRTELGAAIDSVEFVKKASIRASRTAIRSNERPENLGACPSNAKIEPPTQDIVYY